MLDNEDSLVNVIAQYQPCFTEIDNIVATLKMDALPDESATASAQTKLTGLYATLITVYKMCEAVKINKEAQIFVALNEEFERNNPGAKPLSAAKLEQLTNIKVGNYRMLRNILEGYVLASEKAIITCQCNLKSLKNERMFNAINPERS
jgi:hypothetical protein